MKCTQYILAKGIAAIKKNAILISFKQFKFQNRVSERPCYYSNLMFRGANFFQDKNGARSILVIK